MFQRYSPWFISPSRDPRGAIRERKRISRIEKKERDKCRVNRGRKSDVYRCVREGERWRARVVAARRPTRRLCAVPA